MLMHEFLQERYAINSFLILAITSFLLHLPCFKWSPKMIGGDTEYTQAIIMVVFPSSSQHVFAPREACMHAFARRLAFVTQPQLSAYSRCLSRSLGGSASNTRLSFTRRIAYYSPKKRKKKKEKKKARSTSQLRVLTANTARSFCVVSRNFSEVEVWPIYREPRPERLSLYSVILKSLPVHLCIVRMEKFGISHFL